MNTYTKESIPSTFREEVFKRNDHRCVVCGNKEDLTVDHVYPESLGGSLTLENTQTLCRSCNSSKSDRVGWHPSEMLPTCKFDPEHRYRCGSDGCSICSPNSRKRYTMKLVVKAFGVMVFVAVGLCFFLLGPERSTSYIKGGKELIKKEISQNTPMALEFERTKALLKEHQSSIYKFEDRLYDLEGQKKATSKLVGNLEREVASDRGLLETISSRLSEGSNTYEINGRTYTHAQVEKDTLEKVEACKQKEESLSVQRGLLVDLEKNISLGQKSLVEAYSRIKQLQSTISGLETRDASADIRVEVNSLLKSLEVNPLADNTELEVAMGNLEKRISSKERSTNRTSLGGSIDYGNEKPLGAKEALEEFLKK